MLTGLRRRATFEEVLNASIVDENSQHGLLSVHMQKAATNAINNPLFQRIQDTVTNTLEKDQRALLERKDFEHSLSRISVEARVPRDDLQWLVENLQQPPPPPPQPPVAPVSEAVIDYARIAAEMDGALQRQAVETSHRALASEVRQDMQAQAVQTPMQQVIHNHHSYYVGGPTPMAQPQPPTLSGDMRSTGRSAHEIFVAGNSPPPPPPPPGAAAVFVSPQRPPPPQAGYAPTGWFPELPQVQASTSTRPPPPPPGAGAAVQHTANKVQKLVRFWETPPSHTPAARLCKPPGRLCKPAGRLCKPAGRP